MKKQSGATKNSDARLAVKKTAAKGKAAKDPNKPKKPASAFFVFMDDFRNKFKEENYGKSAAQISKAGGAKWKAMSDSDKTPYIAEADKRKKNETDAMMQHEMGIREQLSSERALQLLKLPDVQSSLLVIVCGSGHDGETISVKGHNWIGMDISRLLPGNDVVLENKNENDHDLILDDIVKGLDIKYKEIDGAISISAVQWLCNAADNEQQLSLTLKTFFGSIYRCFRTGATAVFALHPKNDKQSDLVFSLAESAGFIAAVVTDYPDSKKDKKDYLVLTRGPTENSLPRSRCKQRKGTDTKYTARKRKARF